MPPPMKKVKKGHKKKPLSEDGIEEDFTDYNEYSSRIFKIQVEELLKEMDIEMIPDVWINQLKEYLRNIPETSSHSIDDFPLSFVNLPIVKKKNVVKGTFRFITPEKISTVGSFELKTICSAKLPYVMDMAVEIPKACWQGMDFLNERYHRKRALYLAYIAQALMEADFIENLQFTYQNDCYLKPILLITPKGIENKIVSLTAYPSENAFKVNRFIPIRNNVRSSWYLGKINDDDNEIPTYYYNSTIIADLLLIKLNEFLKETITQENIQNAIKLVKLWLIQRGLLSGYGRLNGFIITIFVAYLLKKDKLNCFMNCYQVFRCILLALGHENFVDGISLSSKPNDHTTLEDFKVFPGIFLDESGYLNFLYSVNKETLEMVKHEAKLGLDILDNQPSNSFFLLFMRKISPLEKFEYLIHLKGPKKFRRYSKKLCDTQSCLNYGENKIAAVIPKVCDILRRGLNKRILFLDVIKSSTPSWYVSSKPVSINCGQVTIGVMLNPDVPLSNIEKGPLADDPEAAEFRKFWGNQSEIRRFQDGSIREAVYWPATTFEEKRKVFTQMMKDILKRHLSNEDDFLVIGCNMDKLLNIHKQALSPDFLSYGTGEEAHVTLMESFNSLSKELRKLDGLPLQISSVKGISAAFHYCDVFPSLPISTSYDFSQLMPFSKNSESASKSEIFINHPFIPALNVVIEFEGSGKWPNDIIGIKKLKSIFLIKIAELVKSQYSLLAVPFLTHTDIIKNGFVFRIFIASHKELYLSKIQTLPNGNTKVQDTDESKQLDLIINIYPKVNSLLHGLQLQHFTYGTSCRLAKRWISAQLKENYIHPTTVELIVAHVYMHPEPLTSPSSPQTGFIRFLSLLVNHDWNLSPLIINFNNEFQKNEIEEIHTTFTDQRTTLPPMVIVTPFDRRGILWTKDKPTSLILKRIVILAKASLENLQRNFFNLKDFDVKCIFRPPLDSFNVILHLNHHVISKLMYAVDVGELAAATLPPLKAYKKDDNKYPLIEMDMPKLFFEQLQETYAEFAYFFYDIYGGDFIGLIWKKSAFSPKELKTSHLNCRYLKDDTVVGCKESILEDIKLLGKDIIKYVVKQKD